MKSFKRMLSFFLVLSFSLLFLGTTGLVKNVKAADQVYKTLTFTSSTMDKSVSSYTASWTATVGDDVWNITNANNNSKGWSYIKTGNKTAASVGTITNNAAYSSAVSKVEMTIDAVTVDKVNSIKLYVSSDKTFDASDDVYNINEVGVGVKNFTITTPKENCYYQIAVDCQKGSSNGLVTISKVQYIIETSDVAATGVEISGPTTVAVNNSIELTVTVTPPNATDKKTWTSSDTTVATVNSSGVVTGVKVGTATITFTCGTKSDSYEITVSAAAASTVTLNAISKEVYILDSFTLTATTDPEKTSDVAVWTSSDESIATVTNGVVKALKAGSATITCSYNKDASASCTVTVKNYTAVALTNNCIELTASNLELSTSSSYSESNGNHVVNNLTVVSDSCSMKDTEFSISGTNYPADKAIQIRKTDTKGFGVLTNLNPINGNIQYIAYKLTADVSGANAPTIYVGDSYAPSTKLTKFIKYNGYYYFQVEGNNNQFFMIKNEKSGAAYLDSVKVFTSNPFGLEFSSQETLSSLALTYTNNGDSTYTVNSLKLRFGVYNQITKALYDALVASGSTVTFGVELTANGDTLGHDNTVVFVDANGNEVAKENAVYVNFSVVVPVTKTTNYGQLVVGQAYVSIDGVKYYMGSKTQSVDTLCEYYVNNKATLGLSDEIENVLYYIYCL